MFFALMHLLVRTGNLLEFSQVHVVFFLQGIGFNIVLSVQKEEHFLQVFIFPTRLFHQIKIYPCTLLALLVKERESNKLYLSGFQLDSSN